MFDAECSFTKAAMFGYFRKYRFLQSRSQPRQNCAVEELMIPPEMFHLKRSHEVLDGASGIKITGVGGL